MKLLNLFAAAALTLPSTLAISTQLLKNYCNETLYVTLVLGNDQTEDGEQTPHLLPDSLTPSLPHSLTPLLPCPATTPRPSGIPHKPELTFPWRI